MKKVLFLVTLMSFILVFTIPAKAQIPVKLGNNEYQFSHAGQSSDTLAPTDSIRSLQIEVNKISAVFSNHSIELLHMDVNPINVVVEFQGKYLNIDPNWETFYTATYKGTVTDTIINCNQFTNRLGYNHYRIKAAATVGKARVKKYNGYYKL